MDMDRKSQRTSVLRNIAWGQFAAVTAAFVLYALLGFFAHLMIAMALNAFLPEAMAEPMTGILQGLLGAVIVACLVKRPGQWLLTWPLQVAVYLVLFRMVSVLSPYVVLMLIPAVFEVSQNVWYIFAVWLMEVLTVQMLGVALRVLFRQMGKRLRKE